MQNKKQRIEKIKDEVKEFHPLLESLLPLLPHVVSIEYTHGPNEKGADFVVARTDAVLGEQEYIGVIAKTGDIKQNLDDVERQIKECSMPRLFGGGKKKIVISEIWVVTTGTITNNAEEKINHQYADKKIKFLWSDKIVTMLDRYFPEYWENIDAKVGLYLGGLSRHVDDLILRSSVLDATLTDFYVDQELVRIEQQAQRKFSNKSKLQSEKLTKILEKNQNIMVEAPMGYGKSRLLRQFAKELSDNQNFVASNRLPIFLSFRDLVIKYECSPQKIFDELLKDHKVDHKQFDMIFLIDGTDEIRLSNDEKVDKICSFLSEALSHSNVKTVFASRPFDDPANEEILEKHLCRYALQPLTLPSIIKFVERICTNFDITAKLRSDLQRSDLFKSLPRSPISAILLGRVLATDAKDLPSSLPELYAKYIELALGRWDIHKGKGSEKEYETTQILLRLITRYILDNDLSELPLSTAFEIVNDYLSCRGTGTNAKDAIDALLSKNEILLVDEERKTLYFRHRSFLEFVYAESIYVEHGKKATLPSIFDPYWGSVIYFYLGRLKDCPEQLASIFSVCANDEQQSVLKMFHAGNYLLAAYQTPYSEILKCVRITIEESAETFCKIVNAPTTSRFGKFSEVQLLAIFTAVVRNAFEYDFFKPALIELETELLGDSNTTNEKAIAAFFVSSIRAGLGCKDAFTSLIEHHYSDLPAVVKLGIGHAAKDVGFTNDAVKSLVKRLSRNVRGNQGAVDARKLLYQCPLDEREKKTPQ